MGDYVWINPTGEDNHGLIVVGWGLTQTCANALTNPGQLYLNYIEALAAPNNVIPESNGAAQTVPYVADFAGYWPNNLQRTSPRPFYCTGYSEPGKSAFSGHNWRFYILPNNITISKASLFVDVGWQWP
jgi:hypothetical protein